MSCPSVPVFHGYPQAMVETQSYALPSSLHTRAGSYSSCHALACFEPLTCAVRGWPASSSCVIWDPRRPYPNHRTKVNWLNHSKKALACIVDSSKPIQRPGQWKKTLKVREVLCIVLHFLWERSRVIEPLNSSGVCITHTTPFGVHW